ncbi:MAG: hypothetical protein HFI63_07615 [Lachnospiraceae bacterium]|nr:hypothetical protein [Lachnospiraceae bacterium]
MKKKSNLLAVLALAVILSAGIGKAWAYFTTYAEAAGGYTIELGDRTEIQEEFGEWTKRVSVSNNETSGQSVYIRAKAFSGNAYELTYEDESGKWTPGDGGYYYYSDPVKAGEATGELLVHIGNIPQNANEGDRFHVAVVYESTPVRYDADGNPYADWNEVLDTGATEGGE